MSSLKYHNPNVQMDVVRTKEVCGSPTLTIEFGIYIFNSPLLPSNYMLTLTDSASPQTFDIKDKDRADIYTAVLEATKATLVPTTEEDNALTIAYDKLKKHILQRAGNRKARIEAAKVAGRTMNISPLVQ